MSMQDLTPFPPVLPRPTWLGFISFNPVIWPSVLVCHSDYEDMIAFNGIEKLIWKLMEYAFPDFTPFN